jgi:hypothetical protein
MKKSQRPGKNTSVEVLNISAFGIWLFVDDQEHFASYEKFPWFRDAKVSAVLHVEQPHAGHLYWPDLDIDLSVESLKSPEKFPLVSKSKSSRKNAS